MFYFLIKLTYCQSNFAREQRYKTYFILQLFCGELVYLCGKNKQ